MLAACEPASQPAVDHADSTPPGDQSWPGEIISVTPETSLRLEEYTNQNFGFSLSVPQGYEVQNTFIHTVVFLAPQGTQGHRKRAFLNVELAGDLTAERRAGIPRSIHPLGNALGDQGR